MEKWWVGKVWRPKIDVLKYGTEEPLALVNPPTVHIVGPDGFEETVLAVADSEDATAWEVHVELTAVGTWSISVITPSPAKDVEVASVYANALPVAA